MTAKIWAASPPAVNVVFDTIPGLKINQWYICKQQYSANLEYGYLPFCFYMLNHWLIWVDILDAVLLGLNLPPLITPKARTLQFGDPPISNKWNLLYQKIIQEHNLHCQAFELKGHL